MDYTAWCDDLCNELADYAESNSGSNIHIHGFAQYYIAAKGLSARSNDGVILSTLDVLGSIGIDNRSPAVHLRQKQIAELRQPYDRWQASFAYDLSGMQRLLLEVLNQLSCQADGEGAFRPVDVNLETILADPEIASVDPPITQERAREEFRDLADFGYVRPRLTIGRSQYRSTYAGVTRVSRDSVVSDAEIDDLRSQGESDSLDYKRQISTHSPSEKAEFTKDVLAFANAGGKTKRFLVGVEDDGTFTVPANLADHQRMIARLNETSLQQIVSGRTIHAPSIRIVARGTHREGPYAVIEITTDFRHIPYRFFANPADSKLPGATQAGEVWVRKGTTKQLATPDEITDLETRAANYRKIHP